jgi:hypothetical protein
VTTAWRQVVSAAVASGTWEEPAPWLRVAGLDGLSAQVGAELAAWNSASVTVHLEGTNVHPSAAAGAWASITTVELTADGYGWLGGSDHLAFCGAYHWLRVRVSHAGGTPGDGTVSVYLRGDVE